VASAGVAGREWARYIGGEEEGHAVAASKTNPGTRGPAASRHVSIHTTTGISL
jgi:hypothetical protein